VRSKASSTCARTDLRSIRRTAFSGRCGACASPTPAAARARAFAVRRRLGRGWRAPPASAEAIAAAASTSRAETEGRWSTEPSLDQDRVTLRSGFCVGCPHPMR
jgi:hypothetical protein